MFAPAALQLVRIFPGAGAFKNQIQLKKDILHIDIETYSSVSIKNCGHYKYVQSVDFEIMLLAYAINDRPVQLVDLFIEPLPDEFIRAYNDPTVKNYAHNAAFERTCLNDAAQHDERFDALNFTDPEEWYCTAVLAAYCGYPMSLAGVSAALKLDEQGKAKLSTGKALIKYFCVPCRPTKKNKGRRRNYPLHDLDKWKQFRGYCKQDVEAERAIHKALELQESHIKPSERNMYVLDQKINDRGVKIDLGLADAAVKLDKIHAANLVEKMRKITGIENPNSPAQLKTWLSEKLNKEVKSLAKKELQELIDETPSGSVRDLLLLRQLAAKTSIKKYKKMNDCASEIDMRARGLFQFYGASKTGRWAGRLIQLQNLPRNYINYLNDARIIVKKADYNSALAFLEEKGTGLNSVLSQLIRTAIIAPEGQTFVVCDFSAIEARVIAWLAGETWRLDVFNDHGMIYEASASMMFNVPLENCTKAADALNETDYRSKGKVAELALGYQGGVNALKTMGGEAMGLTDGEMQGIVDKWRKASPNIVKFWYDMENTALRACKSNRKWISKSGITFGRERGYHKNLYIILPSGRRLYYPQATVRQGRFNKDAIFYKGLNQYTNKYEYISTYGGKLTENVVQAVARDILREAMHILEAHGWRIVMHVHDEVVIEAPDGPEDAPELMLKTVEKLMSETLSAQTPWLAGLPLGADGYVTPYYMKD